MLSPLVTKDMQLYKVQKMPKVKNVRSRAQSLDQFSQLQNSASMIDRLIPVKPRISSSTGNIQMSCKLTSRQRVAQQPPATATRSPPKAVMARKTTLSAIQEGVEMPGCSNGTSMSTLSHSKSESSGVQSATECRNIDKKHVLNNNHLNNAQNHPQQNNNGKSHNNNNNNNNNINNKNNNNNNDNNHMSLQLNLSWGSPSTSDEDSPRTENTDELKKTRNVFKWISKTVRKTLRDKNIDTVSTNSN